jgi:hypothetical protein
MLPISTKCRNRKLEQQKLREGPRKRSFKEVHVHNMKHENYNYAKPMENRKYIKNWECKNLGTMATAMTRAMARPRPRPARPRPGPTMGRQGSLGPALARGPHGPVGPKPALGSLTPRSSAGLSGHAPWERGF